MSLWECVQRAAAETSQRVLVVRSEVLGCEVRIRTLTGAERERMEEDAEGRKPHTVRATFLARVIVDEQGDRVFTTEEHIDTLNGIDCTELKRLFDLAWDFNGLSKRGVDALEKN